MPSIGGKNTVQMKQYVAIREDTSFQSFLIVDRMVVCEVDEVVKIPLYLLSAFYAFDMLPNRLHERLLMP